MVQPGWYHTTSGHLVRVLQWPDHQSGGQATYGEVVNIGSFYYDDGGKILQRGSDPVPLGGLELDLASWRPFAAPTSTSIELCEMHRHVDCMACAEGYVPEEASRIQTGDIVVRKNEPLSPRIRVTKMSLDGKGGVFEVIKKNGTPDRRYGGWSGGFAGYRLIAKRTGRPCPFQDGQELRPASG